jgi:polyhydroxyalkanoate synthesis regulator phasin
MALKDKLMSEGMKLAANPAVAKLMQDERFMKAMMAAMAMPGRVSSFTAEQKEHFAKAMGLATQEEVRDLKRTVAALERAVARLESQSKG